MITSMELTICANLIALGALWGQLLTNVNSLKKTVKEYGDRENNLLVRMTRLETLCKERNSKHDKCGDDDSFISDM